MHVNLRVTLPGGISDIIIIIIIIIINSTEGRSKS